MSGNETPPHRAIVLNRDTLIPVTVVAIVASVVWMAATYVERFNNLQPRLERIEADVKTTKETVAAIARRVGIPNFTETTIQDQIKASVEAAP